MGTHSQIYKRGLGTNCMLSNILAYYVKNGHDISELDTIFQNLTYNHVYFKILYIDWLVAVLSPKTFLLIYSSPQDVFLYSFPLFFLFLREREREREKDKTYFFILNHYFKSEHTYLVLLNHIHQYLIHLVTSYLLF